MKLARAKLVVMMLTLAGLVFDAGILLYLCMPTFREIGRLTEEIVRAHSELEAQYLNRRNLLSSGEKVGSARETMRALAAQFQPKGRELDFITAVEGVAAARGVEERLMLTVIEGTKGIEELRVGFDLTLNGASPAVLQTLVDLERMPSLLIVESAVMRPGEGAAGGPSFLSVNLRGAIVAPPAGL
ncbi:MAG: hypothetical protein AAB554_04130 [Patescibacteria group bacterium]